MSELSSTSAAVLGMVALGARTGYDIQRAAERSVRFFWSLAAPQVYAQLKELEAAGLIEGRDEARGARARRVFAVTEDGQRALAAWVAEPAAGGPIELRDPELLRLFFADAVDRDAALARVAQVRRRSEAALEQFSGDILPAAARAREESGAEFPELVAGFGRELHEFIAGWCERVEARLR